ncbi:MM3350-like domain-containing protein [Rhodocollybia butyracea]|uniref:MM3350-like domain-containing protein n=1 Tax=Rhodocollybia butyracea TaxID=206335 RepID=A0A9P5PZF3_9AGAR|nr:MM3350-like domain-containing protein [Rhodocollybia butyracea]
MSADSRKRTQSQLSPRKGSAAKRTRVPAEHDDTSTKDPYLSLPAPTSSYVQLRMQFCGFEDVWRQIRVPTNYTLANLHTVIQYVFGWEDSHLHQMNVWADVQIRGHYITSKGRKGPFPEWLDSNNPNHIAEHYYFGRMKPEYDVRQVMRRRRVISEDFGDSRQIVSDDELTIGQVWNLQLVQNAAGGECTNKQIAIEYEYDLGACWEVHIVLDREDDFFSVNPPSSLPMIVGAKGAPPVEHANVDETETCKTKSISPFILDSETFKLYCEGKVRTHSGLQELKCIYDGAMGEERIAALQSESQPRGNGLQWERRLLPANHAQLVAEILREKERMAKVLAECKRRFRRPDSEDEDDEEEEREGCLVM